MFANSREVSSRQAVAHPRLRDIVTRHLREPYRREPSALGRAAFGVVAARLAQSPFILDAGCGTGASTWALARQFPGQLVLGVDKSAARLSAGRRPQNGSPMPQNAILLHCELVDFWQLAAAARLRCSRQFLLYPNPWPKPEHVMRRWHGHPVLPAILALGGAIELRTNWAVYAQEFVSAMQIAGIEAEFKSWVPESALTPFEQKYFASAHRLWQVRSIAAA